MQKPAARFTVKKIPWTLASGSPRRLALLRQVGIEPNVIVADVDEFHNGLSAEKLAIGNALRKLENVLPRVTEGFVLSADTMVLLDGAILGKPESKEEALASLRTLQNRKHRVITAWVLHHVKSESRSSGVESTDVSMRAISDAELLDYVDSGEPMDKAGAYGIQGAAAAFVEAIDGCYFNVVGLPVSRILREAASLLESITRVSPGKEDATHV